MISWQSIMSVFNTKGTLLKWLQKLEKALKDGVLQSVSVNPVSTGVITLSFNFADGTTITTPQIDLPQGERGPQGVPGADGADGADGTDGTNGRDALVQNRALSSANISSPMAIPIEALNRTAVVGEPIVMFATDTTEEKTYMLIGTVTNVGSPGVNPYVFVTYSNKIDITGMTGPEGMRGPAGETGRGYLFYSNITDIGKIPAAGVGFSTSSAFFNRTPVINDSFVGVFRYGARSFIGTCRVDVAGHAVISLVVETTGAPGSGGGSGIYKHYITDMQDRRATIFTNNGDVMTEWPTEDSEVIVVSLGQVENSEGLGNILFLDSASGVPLEAKYVYVTKDGSLNQDSFTEIQSDEVTAV